MLSLALSLGSASLRRVIPLDPQAVMDLWFSKGVYKATQGSYGVSDITTLAGYGFARAGSKYALNASGVLVPYAPGVPAIRSDLGFNTEGAGTNKCNNYNANPTNLTNIAKSGDAAATLTVVDDTAALLGAGLQNIASSGKVYKLDNSAGVGDAFATTSGVNGNLNATTVSAYVRGSGNFRVDLSAGSGPALATTAATASFVRYSASGVPSASNGSLRVRAFAGAVVYFILNQLEESAYATSPIVVAGSAATRPADALTFAGAWSALGLSGVVEFTRRADTGAAEIIAQLDDGTANNRVALYINSSDQLACIVVAGGVTQADTAVTGAVTVGAAQKAAFAVDTNSVTACRNATLSTEDTSATMPTGLVNLRLGAGVSVASPVYADIGRNRLIPRKFSGAELQAVTL